MKAKHLEAETVGSIKCREENCTFTCHYLHAMRRHLTDRHSIAMEIDQLQFDSTEGEYDLCLCILFNNRLRGMGRGVRMRNKATPTS